MFSSYYSGPGSCNGDSGGPLYKKTIHNGKIQLLLLGITSKGHAYGNCGGIDNPTHYVRIRKMRRWIHGYIKTKKLCIVKSENAHEKVYYYDKTAKHYFIDA